MCSSPGLAALVGALANRAGASPAIEISCETPWASLSFSGTRYRFTLAFSGPAAPAQVASLLNGLGYAEFELSPFILDDIDVVGKRIGHVTTRVEIEALVLAAE